MSALANNEIPTITSLEQAAAWAALALSRVNPSLSVLETSDESTAVAQTAIIRSSTGAPRLVARISIELDAAYTTSGNDLWLDSLELSNTAIPADLKA